MTRTKGLGSKGLVVVLDIIFQKGPKEENKNIEKESLMVFTDNIL